MNWIKKIARPLILVVLPAVIIACSVSYKFNGSSINYDKVKTISIADFPIKSEYVYAPLATKFNEDFEQQFSAFRTYDSSQLLTAVQDGLIAEMSKEITDQIFNATVANW